MITAILVVLLAALLLGALYLVGKTQQRVDDCLEAGGIPVEILSGSANVACFYPESILED